MRLFEIDVTSYKSILNRLDTGDPFKVGEVLFDMGYHHVDAGAFSNVYAKEISRYVIKIGYIQDDCHLIFSDYATQHYRKNPHLPKMKTVKFPVKNYIGFVSIIEKLEPLDPEYANKINDVWYKYRKNINDPYVDASIMKYIPIKSHMRKNLGVFHTINQLRKLTAGTGCKFDLHAGNIMKRKDGTIVLIDPLADPSKL